MLSLNPVNSLHTEEWQCNVCARSWNSLGILTAKHKGPLQQEFKVSSMGCYVSGASASSACVLHFAAVHTRVWILLRLRLQEKFLLIRPGGATWKTVLAASFGTSNDLRVRRLKFTVPVHKQRERENRKSSQVPQQPWKTLHVSSSAAGPVPVA